MPTITTRPALATLLVFTLFACDSTVRDASFGTRMQAITLSVPSDAETIGAALAMARMGDTVQVAAGDYSETVTVPAGVTLQGAGPTSTTLLGRVRGVRDGATFSGFRVVGSGTGFGIYADGEDFRVSGNVVESFASGIRGEATSNAVVDGNVVQRNGIGIDLAETGPAFLVTNNLVLNNSLTGVRVASSSVLPLVAHNTVVGNAFGGADAGAGISVDAGASAKLVNNIVVSNKGGIGSLGTAGTEIRHNLVWGNASNYLGTAVAGTGSLSTDPSFVNPMQGDFHLRQGSLAIDAGAAGLADDDFDGLARPQGAGFDLGAHEFSAPPSTVRLVVSEVMANPSDERRDEFVEVYNSGDTAVDLDEMIFTDGDARDVIVAYAAGTTVVAPGAYAVIVDADYVLGYAIPAGVTTVTLGNRTVGNGLATTDPITLYAADGVTALAAFENPFDPGNGVSAERVDLSGPDVATNWRASPCLQSAGRPNCAPVLLASGLVISEVMSNPLDETTEEFIEIYNGSDDSVDTAAMRITDGRGTDALQGFQGGATVIGPRSYAVILDPDFPSSQMFRIDPSAVLLTVADSALGNGLGVNDPITLTDAAGAIMDTYTRTLAASNGKSVEKVSLSAGDAVGNWAQSSCPAGSSPGSLNCVSSATAGQRKPLAITEVMANPLDEDRGEAIELYNKGIDPVDAAGLLLSDGDATDVLRAFAGGSSVIPAGGHAVILDAEYAGGYAIPADAVRLTTFDTTLGSGLAIDDPIRLLEANGVEIIDTFRFPFNPGNGISAERIDLRAFDSTANWTASSCASRSSPGATNCSASATGLPKRVRITEVMANQAGAENVGEGEFVEFFNAGTLSVDLAGMVLESGPEGGSLGRDPLVTWNAGPTVLVPGAFAIVVDRQYDGRYSTIPSGTVMMTIADNNLGSAGLATTHGITLYDVDGITALDRFRYPSDPGDGVSSSRVSLTAVDSAANWVAASCDASPGRVSCPSGDAVTTHTSFWLDRNASEGGIYWYQSIGWPERAAGSCDESIVCTGGLYGYDFRDNFPAAAAFSFTNPYTAHSVTFVERSGPTDFCDDPCTNPSIAVGPGQTATVPASSLGYYFAITGGPSLNTLDWFGGDPASYWALPPDGTLAPFSVEVVP